MNVNEIQAYVYNASNANMNAAKSSSVVPSDALIKAAQQVVGEVTSTGSFTDAYNEEVAKVKEFKELVSALDGSVLSSMAANASDKDLAALSEDLLGSGRGREVLSKLMEGHFNNIVLTDSEDEEKNPLDSTVDSFNEKVSDTQMLLDGLDKISAAMNNEK